MVCCGIVVGEILRRLVASPRRLHTSSPCPHDQLVIRFPTCDRDVRRGGHIRLEIKASMMSSLRNARGCDDALPSLLQFHGQPFNCTKEDEMGETHDMRRRRRGRSFHASLVRPWSNTKPWRQLGVVAEREAARFLG